MHIVKPSSYQVIANKKYLTTLLLLGLLYGGTAQATDLSKTKIDSMQHEPLSAVIQVTDIDADNFSVSLADSATYQRLNMEKSTPIRVTFVKTSATSGKIILTSATKIDTPFADVVLNVNDNGRTKQIPRTLLLPLGETAKPINSTPQVISATPQPSLPQAGTQRPININQLPAPPKLGSTLSDATSANDQSAIDAIFPVNPTGANTAKSDNMDGLILEETQDVKPAGMGQSATRFDSMVNPAISPNASQVAEPSKPTPPQVANNNTRPKPSSATRSVAKTPKRAPTQPKKTAIPKPSVPVGDARYVVQRNDNLWTIAKQIASRNNISVEEVMTHILAYNPNAFIDQDKDKLMANTTLKLPAYEVIPSQLGVHSAQVARKETKAKAPSAPARPAAPSATQNKSSNQSASAKPKTDTEQTKPTTAKSTKETAINKPLPDARLTLVTPSETGSATGTSDTGDSAKLSSGLLADLKVARARTAKRASKVSELNERLTAQTQQLKINNQKLADLEERLKKLRQK